MKVRFRKNTIRYRLDRRDVESLLAKGWVKEETFIGSSTLSFMVLLDEVPEPSTVLEPGQLLLILPAGMAQPVLDGRQTGIKYSLANKNGSNLDILLERDFKCLVPRGDEDKHAYGNPMEGATC